MKEQIAELKRTRDELALQQAKLAKDHQRLLLQVRVWGVQCSVC